MGHAVAKLFAAEGARVAAIIRQAQSYQQWVGVENVLPIKADITKPEDVTRMVDEAESRFGRLDILCNIAGIHDQLNPLLDTSDEIWSRVIDTDLRAPFQICRKVVAGMVQHGGGVILNYGSLASLRGLHGPSYCAAKAGLIGMTMSIAVAYASKGIRCNVINSGGVYTKITEHSGGAPNPDGLKMFRDITEKLPVDWNCHPEAVAPVALFLCSDEAKHVNGAMIALDGGMSAC